MQRQARYEYLEPCLAMLLMPNTEQSANRGLNGTFVNASYLQPTAKHTTAGAAHY